MAYDLHIVLADDWTDAAVVGEITCSNPNAAQVEKMVELASALGAHVMGDDGEVYELDTWRELISG